MKSLKLFLLPVILLLVSCGSNEPDYTPPENGKNGYLVINEGLYGQNNSSLTFYDIDEDKVYQNVYAAANNGNDLGDTANDFAECRGKGFVVLDKSKKIEIIDLENFQSLGFIDFTDYGSPRNIVIYDSLRAFVTTLSNLVVEINPSAASVTNSIQVGDLPEDLVLHDEKLFVANSGFGQGNTVSVIDITSNSVIKEISVWKNPRFTAADENFVYVISTGEYVPPGLGAVTKINPQTLTPEDTLFIEENPGKAEVIENNLFVIYGEGLAKISLDTFSITDSVFISGSEVNSITNVIYSFAYDYDSERFLLGNPKDFTQNGEVVVFDKNRTELFRFQCGLNPGNIAIIKN